jgi:hypothetical protein
MRRSTPPRRGAAAPGPGALGAGLDRRTPRPLADYDYENLEFRGVGLDLGYIWADKVRNTPSTASGSTWATWDPASASSRPSATGAPSSPASSWTSWPTDLRGHRAWTIPWGRGPGPIRWSDISLSLDGHFVWNTPIRILTFVGAGFGLHALNGQGEAIRARSSRTSWTPSPPASRPSPASSSSRSPGCASTARALHHHERHPVPLGPRRPPVHVPAGHRRPGGHGRARTTPPPETP